MRVESKDMCVCKNILFGYSDNHIGIFDIGKRRYTGKWKVDHVVDNNLNFTRLITDGEYLYFCCSRRSSPAFGGLSPIRNLDNPENGPLAKRLQEGPYQNIIHMFNINGELIHVYYFGKPMAMPETNREMKDEQDSEDSSRPVVFCEPLRPLKEQNKNKKYDMSEKCINESKITTVDRMIVAKSSDLSIKLSDDETNSFVDEVAPLSAGLADSESWADDLLENKTHKITSYVTKSLEWQIFGLDASICIDNNRFGIFRQSTLKLYVLQR